MKPRWWIGVFTSFAPLGLCGDRGYSDNGPIPRIHTITFCDVFDPRLILPLATASTHGFAPLVLGLGLQSSWGPKSGNKANIYRDYVFNQTEPADIVVIFDALDVMFQGSESEIALRYLDIEERTGREIVYNADPYCSSPRQKEFPPADTPWPYLNCGIVIGRSRSLRRLFRDPLPDTIVDSRGKPLRLQNWHINFYLAHQDLALVDTRCELSQVVFGVNEIFVSTQHPEVAKIPGTSALVVSDGKVRNSFTNTTPLILHFPGYGHWPEFSDPVRVGTCTAYEVFRRVGNPELAKLMEKMSASRVSGKMFGQPPWKPICTFYVSPFDYLGIQVSQIGDYTMWVYFQWTPQVLGMLGLLVVLCIRRRRDKILQVILSMVPSLCARHRFYLRTDPVARAV